MAENSSENWWRERLEIAAQVAAVIAVGGYISHRAHLNRLGVSFSTPLSFERYLAEAWYVVSDSLEVLIRTSLVPLALLLLGSAVAAFLASRKRLPQTPAWLRRWKPHVEPVLPLALLLGLLFLLGNLFMPPELPFSVALGPLSVRNLEASSGVEARLRYGLAMQVWLLCLGSLSVLAPSGRRRGLVWLAWLGCRGVLMLGAVALFQHYGVTLHESTYPFVEVRHAKESEVEKITSGALVLESSESLILWSAQQGTGILTSIPRDAVQSIRFTPDIDVLAVALKEAARGPGVPVNPSVAPAAVLPTTPGVQPSTVTSSPAGSP